MNTIKNQIQENIALTNKILTDNNFINIISRVCDLLVDSFNLQKKILIAGNGGSAADAQHIAAELVNRFYLNRKALPAIALTTDSSVITSISNDFSYESIFSRQVEALGNDGDVFIGISTSGNSANIIAALKMCKEKNVKTIGFTGEKKCKMDELCDIIIKVPSSETPRIQEVHILIAHIICKTVEEKLFSL